jgi:nicotinate-nucleotide adenylyltransferase
MNSASPAAVGVFGGTFDPVHYAHLRLAEEARERLSLGRVRWVPSGLPGHRDAPVATAAQRLAMLRLALADDPGSQIDTAELDAPAPTYTINTLLRLRAELGPAAPLALIMGSDQFVTLHTWREWERLFGLAHLAVAERPGHGIDAAHLVPALAAHWAARRAAALPAGASGGIVAFPMTALDISATDIRAAVAARRSARHLLPDNVLAYIHSQRLYRTA